MEVHTSKSQYIVIGLSHWTYNTMHCSSNDYSHSPFLNLQSPCVINGGQHVLVCPDVPLLPLEQRGAKPREGEP